MTRDLKITTLIAELKISWPLSQLGFVLFILLLFKMVYFLFGSMCQ